ncbi:MAG: hypothetical protein U0790_10085 [Isosphaeraceae bacterium]
MSGTGFVLSPLDLGIIVGSLVLVVAVGLWASRGQGKTARGYFLASERLPWWIIGSAFVATSVSSEQIVGTAGAAYQHGMAIVNWEWWCLPTYTLLLVFFLPVYLRSRITTLPEYLSRRFGPLCGDIYSWVMLAAYTIVFLVPVLYGSTLVLSKLTGWSFPAVLWGTVALVGLYTVKGGLASVMWTDAVQCVMLVGGGIALYFVALARIPGGWHAMVLADPDRFHLYHPADDPIAPFPALICGSLGVFLFYQASNQVMVQPRARRSTWDGLMGIVLRASSTCCGPWRPASSGSSSTTGPTSFIGAAAAGQPGHDVPVRPGRVWPGRGRARRDRGWVPRRGDVDGDALANLSATIFAAGYLQAMDPPRCRRSRGGPGRPDGLDARVVIAAVVSPAVERLGGIFTYFQTGVTWLATPFISVFQGHPEADELPGARFGIVGGLSSSSPWHSGHPCWDSGSTGSTRRSSPRSSSWSGWILVSLAATRSCRERNPRSLGLEPGPDGPAPAGDFGPAARSVALWFGSTRCSGSSSTGDGAYSRSARGTR